MKICNNTNCKNSKQCEFFYNFINMKSGTHYTVEQVKPKEDLSCFSLKEYYGN